MSKDLSFGFELRSMPLLLLRISYLIDCCSPKDGLLLQPLHRFAVSTFLLLGLVWGQKDCLHLIMEHCESTFTQPFTLSNRRRILTNQRTIRHLRCVSQFSLTKWDILCGVTTILDRVSTFKHRQINCLWFQVVVLYS